MRYRGCSFASSQESECACSEGAVAESSECSECCFVLDWMVSEVLTCCLCCSVSVAEKVSVAAFKVWAAGGFIGAQRFMRTLI